MVETVNPRLTAINTSLYRVAARAVIVKDGQLLLVKEKDDDYFSTPGGGVDYGETMQEALTRELQEETGLIPGEYEVIEQPVYIGQAIKDGIPRLNIYYRVTLTTGVIKNGQDVEAFRWYAALEVVQNYDTSVTADAEYIVANCMSPHGVGK